MKERECSRCTYWYSNNSGKDTGECRFNPPVLIPKDQEFSHYESLWPETLKEQWCGKFSEGSKDLKYGFRMDQ